MAVIAGYVVTFLVALIGFIISAEIAELWDDHVISRMKAVLEKLESGSSSETEESSDG